MTIDSVVFEGNRLFSSAINFLQRGCSPHTIFLHRNVSEAEWSGGKLVETEAHVYRVLGIVFLICLPVALAFAIFPARSLLRKRIRSGAVGFIGLGCLFVGWVSSWPGPNTITLLMMFGGLLALAAGSFFLVRSFCRLGQ